MAETPPLLQAEFEGLDAMVVRVPAPVPDVSRARVVEGLTIVFLGLGCAGASLVIPVFVTLTGAALLAVAWWNLRRRLTAPVAHHVLRFRPGRLEIGDDVVFLGAVREVRWECDPPVTTLVLETTDGPGHRVVCARRGSGGGIGVTRRQREYVSELIQRAVDDRSGDIPTAMANLVANPPTS